MPRPVDACGIIICDWMFQKTHMTRRTVLIIAHRGASAVAPESTRAAIRAAVRAGAQMIEPDVHLTKDRQLVIIHDYRL